MVSQFISITPESLAITAKAPGLFIHAGNGDDAGGSGFTGLTLHAAIAGGVTASLTLAGFSKADLTSGKFSTPFGHDAASGSDYLYIRGT